tara:strand:+ start:948 stop:3770 length:2823 start_codon:yes stop_codon:yes gene_type:complete
MTSSFGNIIGTQRDEIPKPVIPNYAQTEPNLEEKVNEQIDRNQEDLRRFGEELANIAELRANNFFDNLSGLETLVTKVGSFVETREANREARETRKKFREISKESKQRVLDYQFRLQDADEAEKESLLRELAKKDKVAFELLKAQYFPDVEELNFRETKDRFTSLVPSGYNTYIEDSSIYEQNTEAAAELISEDGIELVLTNFYLELARKNIDINSPQVQRYVNRTLLPKLIKEREQALRTWNQGSYNRYTKRRDASVNDLFVDTINSSEEVTTTDEFGQTTTRIVYNGVFDAPAGEGSLFEIAQKKLGLNTKAEVVSYFTNLITNPSVASKLDVGGILYFLNDASLIDSRTGDTVQGYLNSTFSTEAIRRGNVNVLNDVIEKLIEGDDVAYTNVNKKYEQIIRDYKAANDGSISIGQLAIFESDYTNELRQLGLRTDLFRPSFFTGDETSSQGSEVYSSKVGVANSVKTKSNFKADWELRLKTDQDPFPKLNSVQVLAIPGAEAELERRIEETIRLTGATFDQAFGKHYPIVLEELKDGKFDITFDELRPISPTDIEGDVNGLTSNSSEWMGNKISNSVFEKRSLQQYIKYADGDFKGEFPDYLNQLGAANGMTGREYAIARLRSMGLLSANNNFAENPEDKLELTKEEKKFLFLNANATKNLQLLNTTDDNRDNERYMLDYLKNGNSVEYFEGKGLVSSILDNLGSGQTIRTVEEIYNLAKSGKATNFGLYGFSAEELIAAVDSGAISKDADFNEDTQSLMAVELVRVQANKSNSIMGAVTEADKDWRRLSNLNEIEKAAILRFFPSLRGMPMNQFHNLQQDIALVYLNDVEAANKSLGLDKFIDENPSLEFLRTTDREGQKVKSPTNKVSQFIYESSDRRPGSEEAAKDDRQLLLRNFFKNKIKRGEEVPEEIRRALNFTRRTFNDNFDYLKIYKAK